MHGSSFVKVKVHSRLSCIFSFVFTLVNLRSCARKNTVETHTKSGFLLLRKFYVGMGIRRNEVSLNVFIKSVIKKNQRILKWSRNAREENKKSRKITIRHFHISHNAPHLLLKFWISIVFNFSWDGCNTQEKWKTKVMQHIFWEGRGQIKCIMGNVEVTYWPGL